ncbi:ParB/RepB/Spo0J family partition protein [Gordonia humi]|uniref:ParB family chromosome partitioning protein n=1 Tax=Gordonia humi TaxID=686429 RepID=A0A840EYE1_9ACTN|nr:ParB N-terminal domain-containing protein [Gordonia humi]MBB4138095.1 ParB family chromosome partitioning protein [Gordonia humi]
MTSIIETRTVDPTTVVIADNIREPPSLDTDFVDSVRDGVLVPVLAYLDTDGTVTVIDGQRRTLAAREANLATIPVYIMGRDDALTADEADIERISTQFITNEHRTELRRSERARAIEQLSLAGLSATKIRSKKADIDHTLTAVTSRNALDQLDTHPDLTLDQAAILAKWDHDSEAVDRLLDALEEDGEGGFAHTAQWLEDTTAQREAVAEVAAPLDDGIEWTSTDPWGRAPSLTRYVTEAGTPATLDDVPAAHRLAYIVVEEHNACYDTDGNEVGDTHVDATIEWRVRDATQIGLMYEHEWKRLHPDHNPGDDIDLDAEAARAAARAEAEAQDKRATMRRVKALNKKATTAREVRLAHITSWLTRKTLPKDHKTAIAQFIAETMWSRHTMFGTFRQDGDAEKITADMLGIDKKEQVPEILAAATADRAQLIGLAVVLGAYESTIAKDSWRETYSRRGRTAYLDFLDEVTGYTLTDIEKAMTGTLDPDTIDLD